MEINFADSWEVSRCTDQARRIQPTTMLTQRLPQGRGTRKRVDGAGGRGVFKVELNSRGAEAMRCDDQSALV